MNIWPKQTKKENRENFQRVQETRPESILWTAAKKRAKLKDLEFSITVDDIIIPEVCPYLKVPLERNTRYAPSVDRIDNRYGYVKGNIEVISRKANTMKNDASVKELLEFAYEILERH